jgi:hypothetical protein
VANGGTGVATIASGALLRGNGTSALTAASAADVVAVISTTPVANANALTTSGAWSVTPSGTTLFFNYNGVNVAKLDSSGNLTVKANVTAYGTV